MREPLWNVLEGGFSLLVHQDLFYLSHFKSVKKRRLFDLEVLEMVIILFDIPQDTPLNGQFLSDLPCAGVMTDTGFAVN